MKVNSKSYPHPVLGNEDDIGGSFRVDFRYELGKNEVVLNPVFTLENKTITDLLKKGKASFITEVECRNTFFRKSYASANSENRIVIPASLLRERVAVGFYVCASQDIKGYQPSETHPDYAGATFDIEAGDVLALGGFCSFIAEKSFDPLRPPVSSFMSIMEGTHHEGPIQLDYDAEKITIILSRADWKNYIDVRAHKPAEGILHASIVLPVLVDAVHEVQNESSSYGETSWYARLEAILDAKGLRDREPFEAAQKILENPATRNFTSIAALLDINDERDYE